MEARENGLKHPSVDERDVDVLTGMTQVDHAPSQEPRPMPRLQSQMNRSSTPRPSPELWQDGSPHGYVIPYGSQVSKKRRRSSRRKTNSAAKIVALVLVVGGIAAFAKMIWLKSDETPQPVAVISAGGPADAASPAASVVPIAAPVFTPAPDAMPYFNPDGYAMSISPSWTPQDTGAAPGLTAWFVPSSEGFAFVSISVQRPDRDLDLTTILMDVAAKYGRGDSVGNVISTQILTLADGREIGRLESTDVVRGLLVHDVTYVVKGVGIYYTADLTATAGIWATRSPQIEPYLISLVAI